MSNDEELGIPVDADWREIDGYSCRVCGDAARGHPRISNVWGCLSCKMSTASIYLAFRENDEDVYTE